MTDAPRRFSPEDLEAIRRTRERTARAQRLNLAEVFDSALQAYIDARERKAAAPPELVTDPLFGTLDMMSRYTRNRARESVLGIAVTLFAVAVLGISAELLLFRNLALQAVVSSSWVFFVLLFLVAVSAAWWFRGVSAKAFAVFVAVLLVAFCYEGFRLSRSVDRQQVEAEQRRTVQRDLERAAMRFAVSVGVSLQPPAQSQNNPDPFRVEVTVTEKLQVLATFDPKQGITTVAAKASVVETPPPIEIAYGLVHDSTANSLSLLMANDTPSEFAVSSWFGPVAPKGACVSVAYQAGTKQTSKQALRQAFLVHELPQARPPGRWSRGVRGIASMTPADCSKIPETWFLGYSHSVTKVGVR